MIISREILDKIDEMLPFFESNKIKNIFSWKDLERILNFRPLINDSRFHHVSGRSFWWKQEEFMSDLNSYPIPLVKDLIHQYECYLTDMSKCSKTINNVCTELEEFLACPCDPHIYFSLKDNANAFGIHWDTSHNLIVQVAGFSNIKLWDIQEPWDIMKSIQEESSIDRTATHLDKPPFVNRMMGPGDIAFVPFRYWYELAPETKHITITFACSRTEVMPQDRTWINLSAHS